MENPSYPIRTTHAGSLPRPQALVAMHAARFAGESVDDAHLTQAIEAATRDIIAKLELTRFSGHL